MNLLQIEFPAVATNEAIEQSRKQIQSFFDEIQTLNFDGRSEAFWAALKLMIEHAYLTGLREGSSGMVADINELINDVKRKL